VTAGNRYATSDTYTRRMPSETPAPKPEVFKTQVDGRGGLIRVRLVGEPHDGRELYIDELDLPEVIYTPAAPATFEWWPERLKDVMASTALGGASGNPPVRYVLRVPDDTREPVFVSDAEAR
jgi:hypothetical protein